MHGCHGERSVATSRRHKFKINDLEGFMADFPNLNQKNYKPTSPATPVERNPQRPFHVYNCFALVVGDTTQWWWPAGKGYWPRKDSKDTVDELASLLISDYGFRECGDKQSNGGLEQGIRKVAIFVDKTGSPQHISYQPDYTSNPSRTWKSKIGYNVNMEHTLESICGKLYGHPAKFLYRMFPLETR